MLSFFFFTFLGIAAFGLLAGFALLLIKGIFKTAQAGYYKATGNTASKREIEKLYGRSLDYIKEHPDEDYGYRR